MLKNKTVNIVFILFNAVMFLSNYIFVDFIPFSLLWGWMPSQLAFFIGSIILCAIVWGIYFNKFLDTQAHVDKRYEGK